MMYLKKHIIGEKIVFAICDEELIGKKFSEGDLILDVSYDFYKGEKKSEKELEGIIKDFENVNLVGEKTIKFALKLGILNEENIVVIEGIPHAQIIQV